MQSTRQTQCSIYVNRGTAVALNGYYRHSINIAGELTDKPDIDIWYNPTYENLLSPDLVLEHFCFTNNLSIL